MDNQTIQKDFPYRFDVFDPQYDNLAKELERDNSWSCLPCRCCIPGRRSLWNSGFPDIRNWPELTMENISEVGIRTVGGHLPFWWKRRKSIYGSFSSSIGKMVKSATTETAAGVCPENFKLEVFPVCREATGWVHFFPTSNDIWQAVLLSRMLCQEWGVLQQKGI